jgi:formylmethanofuran dehydrogenase subunit B
MTSHNKIIDFVCPFCSLHCDDVKVSTDGKTFKIHDKNLTCAKKIERNNIRKNSLIFPTINGKVSTLSNAITQIKKNLSTHQELLILNHGVELSGLRAILSLASQYGSIIDHVNSETLFQNLNLLQRSGYMATSLTEIKNRADVIVIFGNKIFEKSPRLLEKVLQTQNSLCTDTRKKEIILVGSFSSKIINDIKKSSRVINIKINLDMIPSFLDLLADDEKYKKINGLSGNDLVKIKKIISNAKYLVAVWTNSDFTLTSNPEMIINSISKYIIAYNKNKRGACSPIAGSLGDVTSSQAIAWMTGFASRVKFIGNTFKHDRVSYNNKVLIDNQNVDTIIHISTLTSDKIKLDKRYFNIVLGHPNSSFSSVPDIFIPVGTPGIDYDGIMFRTDNVVSVALKKIREIKLPSTEDIINRLT